MLSTLLKKIMNIIYNRYLNYLLGFMIKSTLFIIIFFRIQ